MAEKINFKVGTYNTMASHLTNINNGDICFGTYDGKSCVLMIKTNNNLYEITPKFSSDTEINYPLVGQGSEKSPIYSGNVDLLSLDVYGASNNSTGIIKVYGGYKTTTPTETKQVEAIQLYGGNTGSKGSKEAYIKIGNANGSLDSTSGDTDNRYGVIYLYGQKNGANIIKARTNLTQDITFWLPQVGGVDNSAYAVWVDRPDVDGDGQADTLQVGDSNHPVYVNNEGMVVACSRALGNSTSPLDTVHSENWTIYGTYAGTPSLKKFVAGTLTGGWTSSNVPIAALLTLGNTDSGDTNNRYGAIKLYGQNNHYSTILTTPQPDVDTYFTLPATGQNEGTKYVSYATWVPKNNNKNLAVGSTDQPAWVDEDGQLVAINSLSPLYGGTGLTKDTTIFNKLYYYTQTSASDPNPKWVNGNHYIDADKVAINGDFTDINNYTFYVHGSALFDQNFKIESNLSDGYQIDFISSKIKAEANNVTFDTQSTNIISSTIKTEANDVIFDIQSTNGSGGVLWTTSFNNGNTGNFNISSNSIQFDYYTNLNYYYSTISSKGIELWGQSNQDQTMGSSTFNEYGWYMWSSNNSDSSWVDLSVGTGTSKGLNYNYTSPEGAQSSLVFDENFTLTVNSTINLTGATAIAGTLTIADTLTANSELIVKGTSTFNNRAHFKNHIQLVPTTHSTRTDMDYFDVVYTSRDINNNSISLYTPISVFSYRPSTTTEIKGAAMTIGAGGPTVIGGGKSAQAYIDTLKYEANATGWTFPNEDKEIYITSDYAINLISQCDSTTKVTVDEKTNSFVIDDGTMRTVQIYNGSICVEENWGFGTVAPDASTSNVKTGAKVGQVYFKIIE